MMGFANFGFQWSRRKVAASSELREGVPQGERIFKEEMFLRFEARRDPTREVIVFSPRAPRIPVTTGQVVHVVRSEVAIVVQLARAQEDKGFQILAKRDEIDKLNLLVDERAKFRITPESLQSRRGPRIMMSTKKRKSPIDALFGSCDRRVLVSVQNFEGGQLEEFLNPFKGVGRRHRFMTVRGEDVVAKSCVAIRFGHPGRKGTDSDALAKTKIGLDGHMIGELAERMGKRPRDAGGHVKIDEDGKRDTGIKSVKASKVLGRLEGGLILVELGEVREGLEEEVGDGVNGLHGNRVLGVVVEIVNAGEKDSTEILRRNDLMHPSKKKFFSFEGH
jgi:hypothetical protein